MIQMQCECYCGCAEAGDYDGGDFFQCCDTWFCSMCFADHVEDTEDHDF